MQTSWVVLQVCLPFHQMEDVNYSMTMSTQPQASWSLRIDEVNPGDITLFLPHQPIRELCTIWPCTLPHPTPNLAFKKCFARGAQVFLGLEPLPGLLCWPCNKLFSAPNPSISVRLASVCWAQELAILIVGEGSPDNGLELADMRLPHPYYKASFSSTFPYLEDNRCWLEGE